MTTPTPPSTAGLGAELRDLPIGGILSRAARVPVTERDSLFAWRRGVTPIVSKTPGEFAMQTLDAIDEALQHLIRVVVIVRVA